MSNRKHDYVVIFCNRLHSDEFILVLKNKPAWQAGKLNLIGGKIEQGEDCIDAAKRELFEETGYKSEDMRLMGEMRDGGSIIYCMKAKVSQFGSIQPQEGETEQFDWYNWFQVKDDSRLIPNLRVIVPLMRCGVTGFLIEDNDGGCNTTLHTIKVSVPGGKSPN